MAKQRSGKYRQHGSALVMVLWATLLISSLLVGILASVRIEAKLARAKSSAIIAKEAARSALERTAFEIATNPDAAAQLANRRMNIAGNTVIIRMSQDAQKIDLNLASEEELTNYFQTKLPSLEGAQTLAAQIADWRDTDNNSRPNGAERKDYLNSSGAKEIGNRPFINVAELEFVKDMPDGLLPCVRRDFTVFGGNYSTSHTQTGARLATGSRSTTNGARYSLTATATTADQYSASLTGVFRTLGGSELFEFLAIFPAPTQEIDITAEC